MDPLDALATRIDLDCARLGAGAGVILTDWRSWTLSGQIVEAGISGAGYFFCNVVASLIWNRRVFLEYPTDKSRALF